MPDGAEKRESRSLKHWKKMQAESQEFRKKQSKRINDLQKNQCKEMTEEELEAKRTKHAEYMVEWRLKKKMKNQKVKITYDTLSTSESTLHSTSPRSTMKTKTGFRANPPLLKKR